MLHSSDGGSRFETQRPCPAGAGTDVRSVWGSNAEDVYIAGSFVSLASLGVAVEVFIWSERHGETVTARALRRPGHELQRLIGTREPTPEQLAVGEAALDEILRVEGVTAA